MPKKITKIEAQKPKIKKVRVAAYCRISTMQENQLTSIENQLEHYTAMIENHEGWELADVYIEEGVTGTKKDVRPELNRLLSDCKAHKIDLILTKSISRFARNTADCLEMVHMLTDLHVRIIFEKENLDTGRMENEFILTILSSLAEEESHSISENEKWSIQKHMQDGTFRQSKAPYGFQWSNGTNGTLIPDPVEAAVVRWMFEKVLEGRGTSWIAKELNKAALPSPQDRSWCDYTVRKIIQNPAVIGDVLMNKTYKDKNFHRRLNLGEKPMYYQDGHHEAIVDAETFQLAQESIAQRGKEKGNEKAQDVRERHKDPHTNRYPFSGKLICGECGSTLTRVTQYTAAGHKYHWQCSKHKEDVEFCSMKRVMEDDVKNAFVTMIKKLQFAPFILDDYCEEVISHERSEHEERLSAINKGLQQNTEARNRLALLLRSGCVEPVSYNQELIKLEGAAAKMKDERNELMETRENPTAEFQKFVHHFSGDRFPEEGFTQHCEKVVILSQTRFRFVLKCGIELTEEIDPVGNGVSMSQKTVAIPVTAEETETAKAPAAEESATVVEEETPERIEERKVLKAS